MSIDRTLEGDGFIPVGHISIQPPSTFLVQFDVRKDAEWWPAVIYAFRVRNEVVRIGKSKGILCGRMKQWQRDVSRALEGNYGPGRTNSWEADHWRRLLESTKGEILALRIDPPDAEVLIRQEKQLIRDYDPLLCGDAPSYRLRRYGK